MTIKFKLLKPQSKLSDTLTPWKPHAYQKRSKKFLIEHAACALFLDPGLGKTAITLSALMDLVKKNTISKPLIIAPLRVCHLVWPAEIAKWKQFSKLKIVVLHGPKKEKLLDEPADIYIINPEGLNWLFDVSVIKTKTIDGRTKTSVAPNMKRVKKLGFDALVIDELTKFKNSNAIRFKAMKHVLSTFSIRWGLTGSPAANGLENLFAQCYMLDMGRTLGQYITQYRRDHFNPHPSGFGWMLRPGEEQKIYKKLSPLVLRMKATDYLDLPTLINNEITVELPPKVRLIYDQLEADMIANLGDKVLVASAASAVSIKCRQIANGGIYLDSEVEALVQLPKSQRDWVNLHTEKVDAVGDLMEELQGSPLLVAYDFGHDLDRLRERFGKDIPYIGSGVSTSRLQQLEKDWNSGKLEVLFGHPQSMAHGLNLQECANHVCWHSLTWDFELYDQFIKRVLRQGNKNKRVFNHLIIAKDTLDKTMVYSLSSKNKGQNALFLGLEQLRAEYKRKNICK